MDDEMLMLDRVESTSSSCAGLSVLSEADESGGAEELASVASTEASAAAPVQPDGEEPAEQMSSELCQPEAVELASPEVAAAADAQPTDQPDAPPTDQIVEALLFSADTPLSLGRVSELAGCSQMEARLAIADLNARYMVAKLSFRIEEIARGYQMMTLPRFQPWLTRLTAQRIQTRLSPAALETLSIIAYKQPIIRADIEAIRGVAAGEVLNRLREMGLVRIVGRAEVVGRPLLYSTTKKFLDVFGLADLEDLPPLEALNLRRRIAKADEPVANAVDSSAAPAADSEGDAQTETRLAASA